MTSPQQPRKTLAYAMERFSGQACTGPLVGFRYTDGQFTVQNVCAEPGEYTWVGAVSKITTSVPYSHSCTKCLVCQSNMRNAIDLDEYAQDKKARHRLLVNRRRYDEAKTTTDGLSSVSADLDAATFRRQARVRTNGRTARLVLWGGADGYDWLRHVEYVDARVHNESADTLRLMVSRADAIVVLDMVTLFESSVPKTFVVTDDAVDAVLIGGVESRACAFFLRGAASAYLLNRMADEGSPVVGVAFLTPELVSRDVAVKECLHHLIDHIERKVSVTPEKMYGKTVGHRQEHDYAQCNRRKRRYDGEAGGVTSVGTLDTVDCECTRNHGNERRLYELVTSDFDGSLENEHARLTAKRMSTTYIDWTASRERSSVYMYGASIHTEHHLTEHRRM